MLLLLRYVTVTLPVFRHVWTLDPHSPPKRLNMIRLFPMLLVASTLITGCANRPPESNPLSSNVEILEANGTFSMTRNGKPFFVRGGGGQSHLDVLAAAGGNSIRTWGADDAGEVLDRAHQNGLTVTLGIWLQHPRHGFDYNNKKAVAEQREMVRQIVREHKDHPALLMWGVGNEVELASDPALVFPEINNLAKMIKKIDPNHPTMAVIAAAEGNKIERFIEMCPDVDVLGVNAYADVVDVPEALTAHGYTGPYLVTEFGPRGHWQSPTSAWRAPLEQTSTEKAESYRVGYEAAVASQPGRCLGSYVFLWGQKQETTATWYGMFLPSGESTGTLDTMHRLWSGSEPTSRAPVIGPIESPVVLDLVDPDTELWAEIAASDPDGDALTYEWLVVAESNDRKSGGDAEDAPSSLPDLTITNGPRATFQTPSEQGAYRLFVKVTDGTGRAATANVPFLVR